jgi:hypothetical protein
VDPEDRAAARVWVEQVREARDFTSAEIEERQGTDRGRQFSRETIGVALRLDLDAGQGMADRLGLEDAGRLALDEEHVVREPVPRGQPELADSHATAGVDVHLLAILDNPARLAQRLVDERPCRLLRTGAGWRSHCALLCTVPPRD